MDNVVGFYVFTTVNGGEWLAPGGKRTSSFHEAAEFSSKDKAEIFADKHIIDEKEAPYIFALMH